jgi:hypothetical protein
VVAEEFEALVAAGTAAAGQRRDVGQRALQQVAVLETVADGLLESAGRCNAFAGGSASLGGSRFCGLLLRANVRFGTLGR